ncbi:MAG TPA: ATP-binding protein [bacterium]|nr:ATP-binding protein [bacterium]
MGDQPRSDDAEHVEVTIPARAEFVSVVRLTTAAVAARQGLVYDEIEDLKIAVSEACTSLITAGVAAGSALVVRFALGRRALEVSIDGYGPGIVLDAGAPDGNVPLDESRLGVFLMQCLVDEVEARRDVAAGTAGVRLVKRHGG